MSWDCHAHVIEEPARFPLWPGRGYEPPIATLDAYLKLLDRYQITHGVLVQPSVYGFDNRCMLDALDRADGRLFGVAVPAPDATPADLEAMHRRGVRAVRCNRVNAGGITVDIIAKWLPALRDLGWHVQLHLAIEQIDLYELLNRIYVPLVIDHMGRPQPGRTDPSSPELQHLVEFVRTGHCYVKLSAPYRLSATGSPWTDVQPLAQALLDANAAYCLWGSDWPHPDTNEVVSPEDVFGVAAQWGAGRATGASALFS